MKRNKKRGQGFVEYALLLALIVIVAIGAFKSMGQSANNAAQAVATNLQTAVG